MAYRHNTKTKRSTVKEMIDNDTTRLLVKSLAVLLTLCCLLMFLPVLSYAENYTYDTVGRLTGVIYDDGSSIIYTYDAAGNRLARMVSAGAGCKGDLNEDGDVDGHDSANFVSDYASQQSGADLNGDTFFNAQDVQIFADEFGKIDCQ